MTYIVSDILNKLLPFLLLPILTRYLMPSDYGILSVFTAIVGFLAVFVGLGSQEMVRVNYFQQSKRELSEYIGHVLIITISTSVIYLLIFLLVRDFIWEKYGLSFFWLAVAVLITFLEFFKKIISIIWIAEGRSMVFAKFSNISSLTIVLTTLFFVVLLEWNWQGRVYSLLVSMAIFSGIAFYFIKKKGFIQLRHNWEGLKHCLKESIGVLPYSVSFWFKNSALLLIMAYLIGNTETGLYASALRIAIIVNFIALAINKVWQPALFKIMADKINDNRLRIVKIFYLYLGLIILAGIFIIIFSGIIVKIILGPAYQEASIYVRYLTLAIMLQSLFTAMADFLIFHKASGSLTMVSISGIILQYLLIIAFFLFMEITVMNIIYSSILAGIYTLIIAFFQVRKTRPLPWFYFLKIKKG